MAHMGRILHNRYNAVASDSRGTWPAKFPCDGELGNRVTEFCNSVVSSVNEEGMEVSARNWSDLVYSLLPEEVRSIQNTWGNYIREETEATYNSFIDCCNAVVYRCNTGLVSA